MNNIAVVVITGATREFDKEYHYRIPDDLMGKVKPGIRVMVPFGNGNRTKEGYVFNIVDTSDFAKLKSIVRVVDIDPVLSPKLIELAVWMKKRYICTFADALKCMLPAGMGVKSFRIITLVNKNSEKLVNNVQSKIVEILESLNNECEYTELQKLVNEKSFTKHIKAFETASIIKIHEEHTTAVREKYVRVSYLDMPVDEVIFDIENNKIKKIQQIRVLEMLIENPYISVADLARFAGVSASVLDTLRKYGYINYKDVEVMRDPLKHRNIEKTYAMKPTRQQNDALGIIDKKIEEEKFDEILIHGITGSGKTEVYLQLIQKVISLGKQAIVLVPEISLTPQMVDRFKGRFGDEVAVIHSRLSLGERFDQWRLIKDGKINVVVGARSAIFAPFEKIGAVIIDEEHEYSYKSEITPKYNALDIARERCKNDNALLILGSATPSVETFYRAKKGETSFIEMTERANLMVMPKVRIIDMKKELEDGNRSVFSAALSEEIEKNIKSGQQTILFLNRRGYASFVLCRSCGLSIKCPHCNISLTYHSTGERLICHYCGHTVKMPKICPKCESPHIRQFGTGTQKIEEELIKRFEGCKVIRMDMDTTSGKNSHEELLDAFREQKGNILLGTQMIAKGHDFPNVTLVGVLAADSILNMDDYRASEKTFQLITQVAGRAGRGELPGRVIIQAYNTEDFSITSACNHNYSGFYKQEIIIREKLVYPPFTNIAIVLFSSADDRLAFNKAKLVSESINKNFDTRESEDLIIGPLRAPLSKIKNKYRWRIVIKCSSSEKLVNLLSTVADEFHGSNSKSGVDLSVDINPVNML